MVRVAVAVALGAVLVAAGCGGGSSRLSKSELDAKANAVCAKYDAKIKALKEPKSISDVSRYVDEVEPLIKKGIGEISKLEPPKDLQRTFDRWVRTQREALDQADQLKTAAAKNDLAAVQRVIKALGERNKRGNALASQLGAQTCAED